MKRNLQNKGKAMPLSINQSLHCNNILNPDTDI